MHLYKLSQHHFAACLPQPVPADFSHYLSCSLPKVSLISSKGFTILIFNLITNFFSTHHLPHSHVNIPNLILDSINILSAHKGYVCPGHMYVLDMMSSVQTLH